MRGLLSIAAMACVGCAPWIDVYRPSEELTAVAGDVPAARYPITGEARRGEALIAATGIVQPRLASGQHAAYLAVRIVVDNDDDDAPWTLDLRQQRVTFPALGTLAPAYVDSDGRDLPLLVVAPGRKRTVDLYYALPPPLTKPREVPTFTLDWRVQTPAALICARTEFALVRVKPEEVHYPRYMYSASAPLLRRLE
jgi:hypothetical protein